MLSFCEQALASIHAEARRSKKKKNKTQEAWIKFLSRSAKTRSKRNNSTATIHRVTLAQLITVDETKLEGSLERGETILG